MKVKPQHTQTYNESIPKRNTIALSASKKKLERAHTSSLTTHLKALEKKEENSPKRSRRQEIIKLGRNQPSGNKKNYSKN